MAYSELVKNFEKVRDYMREFYVYGFKSRSEFHAKSARSYDDERRRIESWLGDYMHFTQTPEGKNIFLSVDSRVTAENPFYKAWKTKSFTDGDITLHFILFDILCDPDIRKTLSELVEQIDEYLCEFEEPMTFDESTIRKKLKEYVQEGIIRMVKEGRNVLYSRMPDTDLSGLSDAIHFFSEAAPCGVVGSFLGDKLEPEPKVFLFKHHYMTHALDSDVLARILDAIQGKRYITADNLSRHSGRFSTVRLVPLRICISAQNGRQNLIAHHEGMNRLHTYRLDYLSNVRVEEPCAHFDALREKLCQVEQHMWGVNCHWGLDQLEHVEFEIRAEENEPFILRRLEREKRCGTIEKIDDHHYRYQADVFDTIEMLPWIRTFLTRITRLDFSNKIAENRFREDLKEMYRMYGIEDGEEA